jgi:hypothetical protein
VSRLSNVNSTVFKYGDRHGALTWKLKDWIGADIQPKEILAGLSACYSRTVYQQALATVLESTDISAITRYQIVYKTQLAQHLGISFRHLDRALVQFEFEEMVKQDLDEYCWLERLDSVSLSQVLQHTSGNNCRYSYSARKNCLLMSFDGGKSGSEEMMLKTRVGFGLFHDLFIKGKTEFLGGEVVLEDEDAEVVQQEPEEHRTSYMGTMKPATPEKGDTKPVDELPASTSIVYVTTDNVVQFENTAKIFYTGDGSRIERNICESTILDTECRYKYSWNDNLITYATDGQYITLATNDDYVVSISIDDDKNLRLQASASDGLFVDILSSKTVIQKRFKSVESFSTILEQKSGEVSIPWTRTTLKNGTTIIHKDNKVRAICPDGSCHTQSEIDGSWTTTSQLGEISRSTSTGEVIAESEKTSIHIAKDYQNDAVVVAREDLVNITLNGVTCQDEGSPSKASSIEVEHDDATIMKNQAGRTVVVHPSFAKLVVDESGVTVGFPNNMVIEQKENGVIVRMVLLRKSLNSRLILYSG